MGAMVLRVQMLRTGEQLGRHWSQRLVLKFQVRQLAEPQGWTQSPLLRKQAVTQIWQAWASTLKLAQATGILTQPLNLTEKQELVPQLMGRQAPLLRQKAVEMQVVQEPLLNAAEQVLDMHMLPNAQVPSLHTTVLQLATHCPLASLYCVGFRQLRQSPVQESKESQRGLTEQHTPQWQYCRLVQGLGSRHCPLLQVQPLTHDRHLRLVQSQLQQGGPGWDWVGPTHPEKVPQQSVKAELKGQGQEEVGKVMVTQEDGTVNNRTQQPVVSPEILYVVTPLATVEETLVGTPAAWNWLELLILMAARETLEVELMLAEAKAGSSCATQMYLTTLGLRMSVSLRRVVVPVVAMSWYILTAVLGAGPETCRQQVAVELTVQLAEQGEPVKVRVVMVAALLASLTTTAQSLMLLSLGWMVTLSTEPLLRVPRAQEGGAQRLLVPALKVQLIRLRQQALARSSASRASLISGECMCLWFIGYKSVQANLGQFKSVFGSGTQHPQACLLRPSFMCIQSIKKREAGPFNSIFLTICPQRQKQTMFNGLIKQQDHWG